MTVLYKQVIFLSLPAEKEWSLEKVKLTQKCLQSFWSETHLGPVPISSSAAAASGACLTAGCLMPGNVNA